MELLASWASPLSQRPSYDRPADPAGEEGPSQYAAAFGLSPLGGPGDTRTQWVARRIKDAIGEDAQERVNVDSFVQSGNVSRRLDEFYAAQGPPCIMFFFQQVQASTLFADVDDEPEMRLLLTDGIDEKLNGKCIYFVRRVHSVLPDTRTPDLDMSCGEVTADILESFHQTLHSAFLPLLEGGLQDWGKSTEENTNEYLSAATRFDEMIADAVSSLSGGIELQKPETRFMIDSKQQAYHQAAQDPEVLAVYENVMKAWCVQCDELLAESAVDEEVADESGPDTEFEFWRKRMAKFNSVVEQLKTRECKIVLGVVGQIGTKSQCFRRWKQVDTLITDSLNEARDNVKCLSALERYTESLYSGTPASIIEALPALIQNMKVMLTISRFYGTADRMTVLFRKITNQIILRCKDSINNKDAASAASGVRLWDQDFPSLLERLKAVLKLHNVYRSVYSSTKDKLAQNSKGKQFEFDESIIFGRLDEFCKRVQKLLDMFTTIHQFSCLAEYKVEGTESLMQRFFDIVIDFKRKPYDLLDIKQRAFDRDYLEYTANVGELEQQMQTFINLSFEKILSTEQALSLLKKFETVLVRDSLKSDLESKYTVIFQNYGLDLDEVQRLYEKQKLSPPLLRNAPPVTGNMLWSKQLLRRIDEPMRRFKAHSSLTHNSRDAKKIVRTYNKVARALVEFETLWHTAWTKSIEAARSGLQATLIIRHPITDNLFVNFDREILQLIREAKCLQRFKVKVPDVARMVLVHEDKYKSYFNQLSFALSEYERIVSMVMPLTKPLLQPLLDDLENKIQPGRVLLTWQSMNIDGYLQRMHAGFSKFEDLLKKISDILDNRIEKNLRKIAKTLLVELPSNESLTLEQFVILQEKTTKIKTVLLESKNEEVENAVIDVIHAITSYPLEIAENVSKEAIQAFWDHYTRQIYLSVMRCTKESFFALKKRLTSKTSGGFLFMEQPFFDVDVELSGGFVAMNPSLDEIQAAINRSALNILRCSKHISQWPKKPRTESLGATEKRTERQSFHQVIAQDYQIVAVCLMLTGAVEGTKKQVHEYLQTFLRYDFLWKEEKKIDDFISQPKSVFEFEEEILRFLAIEDLVGQIPPVHNIGSLSLETGLLKQALRREACDWKTLYTSKLHEQAREEVARFYTEVKVFQDKLDLDCQNIDDAKNVMMVLDEIRDKEMDMESRIKPIQQYFHVLKKYGHPIDTEEDSILVEKENEKQVRHNSLSKSWAEVIEKALEVNSNLHDRQGHFLDALLSDVREFQEQVDEFRKDFIEHGPMEEGITPFEASERMTKYKKQFNALEDRWRRHAASEELFGLPMTQYMALDVTRKELLLLDKLYSLYTAVRRTIADYRQRVWVEATAEMGAMTDQVNFFLQKCKKMPMQLRGWDAYRDLKKDIDDFVEVLPLIEALSSPAMRPRHWQEIQRISEVEFDNESLDLTVGGMLETGLHRKRDQVEAISHTAERQLEVELKLLELDETWTETRLEFLRFKTKGPVLLKARELASIFEKVEESTNTIGTMVALPHSEPFREEIQSWIRKLNSMQEVLEQWAHVQSTWVHMEAVFSNSDIAKQLPQEAKRFGAVDEGYVKLMNKAFEISNVLQCCDGYDPMKTVLPELAVQLDMCQKSLQGYFEAKRMLFPRFFFLSDSVLLEILSEGSDPQNIVAHMSMLFDSLASVITDDSHVKIMISDDGEQVRLSAQHELIGSAEEWLKQLVGVMRDTIQDITRECAHTVLANSDPGLMKGLLEQYPGQVSRVGLQLYWTHLAEEAFTLSKTDKMIMSNTAKKFEADLHQLLGFVKDSNLAVSNRLKIESQITVQMFQTETFVEMVKSKIRDRNDFEWQKQIRSKWKSDEDRYVVQVMNTAMGYQNEFLGCKECLVLTPLTNRSYVTIFQALYMQLGVATFGPAGMGKTNTIKDVGRTLGKYVVTFNCSNQFGFKELAKILKGVAMSGCWGCFDDFGRVNSDAIAVAAQQMSTILSAKRAKAPQFVFTDGDNGVLDERSAFFMTLLPAANNTLPLPENIRTYVRPIMMLTTDSTTILRVKLSACGFTESDSLAKKLNCLYEMCRQCLSQQCHNDFGLRNISTLIMTCGRAKRAAARDKDITESQIVVQALKSVNLSSLTLEDSAVFANLVQALFPGVSGEKLQNVKQSEIIRSICDSRLLEYDSISTSRWAEKLVNFLEMYDLRHGLGLIGPSGSGKSSIMATCIEVISETKHIPQSVRKLNPKAIEVSQILGHYDALTSKWCEGIFTALWRKATLNSNGGDWIIFDGPVDSEWMENLNSALDGTKVLTLANGDRLPVPEHLTIVLETDHLQHASPAVVSRIGIVHVSSETLGYEPCVSSWVKTKPPDQQEVLKNVLERCLSSVVSTAARILKPVMEVSSMMLVENMLRLLDVLLARVFDSDAGNSLHPTMERIIFFAICWSFGGPVEAEGRTRLEAELKKLIPAGCPSADCGKAFECFLDRHGVWNPIAKLDIFWQIPDSSDYMNLYVPTHHNAQYRMHLEMTVPQKMPILLLGGAGVSKTATIVQFIHERCAKDGLPMKRAALSFNTTPFALQRVIENAVERRQGRVYGPSHYRSCSVLIDDVNVTCIGKWGDQPCSEFLRQLLSENGFYNIDKPGEWKNIVDLQYYATMTHSGGRMQNDIPSRLKRRMLPINMPAPPPSAVEHIVTTVFNAHFSEKMVGRDIALVASKFAEPTVTIWNTLRERLSHHSSKFHYNYTMKDISNVLSGMLRCSRSLFPQGKDGKEYVARLWKHEIERALTDKLDCTSDQTMAENYIQETVSEALADVKHLSTQHFGKYYFGAFPLEESIESEEFTETEDVSNLQPYDLCLSVQDAQMKVDRLLRSYNRHPQTRARMDLVLFPYVVEFLIRILRAICIDGASCLLVGLRASGKMSLALLATYILDHEVLRIRRASAYTRLDLLSDIKSYCKYAAVNNKHFTLLMSDTDILDECFLDLVNQLVSTGEITDSFTKEEISTIVSESFSRAQGQTSSPEASESIEDMTNFFLHRIRRNFHCVLCFSPLDENLAHRIQKYPALMSSFHLIWFTAWPDQGMAKIAEHRFRKNNIKIEAEEEFVKRLPEIHRLSHLSFNEYDKHSKQIQQISQIQYILFIETFCHIYTSKDTELRLAIKKVKKGLQKLEQAVADVTKMQCDIEESESSLQEAQADASNILRQIADQQSITERQKKVCKESSQNSAAVSDLVQAQRTEVDKELEEAAPLLLAAENTLKSINQKDLHALKTLKSAPVKAVLDVILILLQKPLVPVKIVDEKGEKYYKDSYNTALILMNEKDQFLDFLFKFPRDSINDETIELLQPYIDSQPKADQQMLNPISNESIKKSSPAVAALYTWAESMHDFYKYVGKSNPAKTRLLEMESNLREVQNRADIEEMELTKASQKLEEMKRALADALNNKTVILDKAEKTRENLKSINALIRMLSDGKERWQQSVREYTRSLGALPGDVATAACFLTYCGPLVKDGRAKLCKSVQTTLQGNMSSQDEEANARRYQDLVFDLLCTATEKAEWAKQGLPADPYSVENGLLVTKALRWPFLMDPEGQGLAWIKNKEKDVLKPTTVVDPNFMHVFQDCINHGRSLLIENVDNFLHPILQCVLDRQADFRENGEVMLTIGEKNMTCTSGFALYVTTKRPNNLFSPEVSRHFTMINFKLTKESLQEQLFLHIVEKERPDFYAQKTFTVTELHDLQRDAEKVQSEVLIRLCKIHDHGSILDDTSLIHVLEKEKSLDRTIKDREKIVDGLSKKINHSCADLRFVAKKASALYAAMVELIQINPMYSTSLQSFKETFQRSIAHTPKEHKIDVKAHNMINRFSWDFFSAIRRGLFQSDRSLFALLIALKIKLFDDDISEKQYSCFVECGSGLDSDGLRAKPYNWIPMQSWMNVMALFQAFPVFKDLPDSLQHSGEQWRSWYDSTAPETTKFPEISSAFDKITPFLRMMIVRAMRPDRLVQAACNFVKDVLDERYVEAISTDFEEMYLDSKPKKPLIFLLSSGADPTNILLSLGRKLKRELLAVSLGQGQNIVARRNFDTGIQIGCWVLFQHAHLDINFLYEIEQSLTKIESVNDDFRLFMTTEKAPTFPVGLLQMSLKMTNDAPEGVRAGLSRLYSLMSQDVFETISRPEWRLLLFSLSFMHSVMLARGRFGTHGWSTPSNFGQADFGCSATVLENYVRELDSKIHKGINWEALRAIIGQTLYGGDRSDGNDLMVLHLLSEKYLSPRALESSFSYAAGYATPAGTDIGAFRSHIQSFPATEKPELIGLSATSEFVLGLRQTDDLLEKLSSTLACVDTTIGNTRRPQTSDEQILPRIQEILQRFPQPFSNSDISDALEKDGGLNLATNVAFRHEVRWFNGAVSTARHTLQRTHSMLSGHLSKSITLTRAARDIYMNKVPLSWEKLSWNATNLGHWMQQLQDRLQQWKRWIDRGRPFSFWLGGFSNPLGFLCAVKQDVFINQTGWALENCVLSAEVTKLDPTEIKATAENGVFIHGLWLDGASWNKKEAKIVEALNRMPMSQLPVLYMRVVQQATQKYDDQVYECPCYTSQSRMYQNYVCCVDLKTGESPARWILRGVALLTSIE